LRPFSSFPQEWRYQLRSSLHPLLFSAVYKTSDFLAASLHLSAATSAELLVASPKVAQAIVAAIGDFYTWKLATRIYGRDSRGSWTTVRRSCAMASWPHRRSLRGKKQTRENKIG
jgi:hypothetical protein